MNRRLSLFKIRFFVSLIVFLCLVLLGITCQLPQKLKPQTIATPYVPLIMPSTALPNKEGSLTTESRITDTISIQIITTTKVLTITISDVKKETDRFYEGAFFTCLYFLGGGMKGLPNLTAEQQNNITFQCNEFVLFQSNVMEWHTIGITESVQPSEILTLTIESGGGIG